MTERCGLGCVRPVGHEGECRDSWRHVIRCNALMPIAGERCARSAGHANSHRTAAALEHDRLMRCGHPLAARAIRGNETRCWACEVEAA